MLDLRVLRDELRVDADDDRKVVRLRDAVVALFEGRTGRSWKRQVGRQETRIRHGASQTVLYLDVKPVESIQEIVERDYGGRWSDPFAEQDYILDPQSGRLEKLSGRWDKHVRVTYSGGIDQTGSNTPADIREALLVQAKFMHERLASDKIAVRSVATGGRDGAVTFLENGPLHPLFREVAERHRVQ